MDVHVCCSQMKGGEFVYMVIVRKKLGMGQSINCVKHTILSGVVPGLVYPRTNTKFLEILTSLDGSTGNLPILLRV